MKRERVKFFDPNDILFGFNLERIEKIDIAEFANITINDAIEFYEIKKYFDIKTQLSTWSKEEFEKYSSKSKRIYSYCLRFFNTINNDNIFEEYQKVDCDYKSSFWELFEKCQLFKKISESIFEQLLNFEDVSYYAIFTLKKTITTYEKTCKKYILEKESGIILLLDYFEQDFKIDAKKRLYIPTLSDEEIASYFESYCNSQTTNPNHLERIVDTSANISDELRLKARRKYETEVKNRIKNSVTIKNSILIEIDPNQQDPFVNKTKGTGFHFSYSEKYLLDTLDYQDILNNFIYLFNYVDIKQQRCSFVSKKALASTIEYVFSTHSKRHYFVSSVFNALNALSTMQMQCYYEFLEQTDIYLEDVLKWFFTSYLQKEFGCSEMRLNFPTKETSYAEKCSTIIPTFDAAIKQFTKYVQNGEIDFELIRMSTKPIILNNIPSLNKNKYVYGIGNKFHYLCYLLFSDQCLLSYVERINKRNKEYSNFFELVSNEKVYLSDYKTNNKKYLKDLALLKENGLIDYSMENEGLITLNNFFKLYVFRDLYYNEVISKYRYPQSFDKIFKELSESELIIEKSSLFSVPEANYLNYMLNRSEYCNGLEIRNQYIHGNQHVNPDEEEHKTNYYILLKLFVLLAIKINDDFCLKIPETKNDEREKSQHT